MTLSIGLLLFATSNKGYGADDNLITNAYAPSWNASPFGFGGWIKNPDNPEVDVLKLVGSAPGPAWMIGGLPFLSGQFYELSMKIKAPVGVEYRYYVACNGKDGQQAHGGNGVGTGQWETQKKAFLFKDFLNDQTIERGMVAIALTSAGEFLVSDVTIVESVDKQQRAVDALERDGEVSLIAEGEEEPWSFVGNDFTVGKWMFGQDGKGSPSLNIKSDDATGTYWTRGNLPIASNVGYVCSYKVKAERGMKYRVYLENNTDGRWQNFSAGEHVGTGRWEQSECAVYFSDISKKCYVVMQAMSPGVIDFADLKIKKDSRAARKVTRQ